MTGQDGGFREAATRFSAEVESALTRARRAAGEAKAQSGEFRRATAELAEQAKTGQLRGVRRDQVDPTAAEARAEAEKFRNANGLDVTEFPDADELIARLPEEEPQPVAEDEDFSQHLILVDVDVRDEPEAAEKPASAPDPEAPEPNDARSSDDEEDFSQQRILLDATVESYRPDPLQTGLFEQADPQNPS